MPADDRIRRGGAIVMRRYGGPDVLGFEAVPLAALKPDEIRLRSLASAINHSDLEIRVGNWPIRRPEPFPYTPGLETVGEVVEIGTAVADFRVGDRAITMMQGMGGVRAGPADMPNTWLWERALPRRWRRISIRSQWRR
jgi:NADPH:quinone reductase